MTIQDILDLMVDNGTQYVIKVWEDNSQAERDYDENEDSELEFNSFEFEHRYYEDNKDYLVFNVD